MDRTYTYACDFFPLVQILRDTDDECSVILSPDNFHLGNCDGLSYLELGNTLREKAVRPYLLKCSERFRPEVVPLTAVISQKVRRRWFDGFLSVRDREDFAL